METIEGRIYYLYRLPLGDWKILTDDGDVWIRQVISRWEGEQVKITIEEVKEDGAN